MSRLILPGRRTECFRVTGKVLQRPMVPERKSTSGDRDLKTKKT